MVKIITVINKEHRCSIYDLLMSRVENNLLSEVYYKLHIFDVLLFVGMILLKSQNKSDIFISIMG